MQLIVISRVLYECSAYGEPLSFSRLPSLDRRYHVALSPVQSPPLRCHLVRAGLLPEEPLLFVHTFIRSRGVVARCSEATSGAAARLWQRRPLCVSSLF